MMLMVSDVDVDGDVMGWDGWDHATNMPSRSINGQYIHIHIYIYIAADSPSSM